MFVKTKNEVAIVVWIFVAVSVLSLPNLLPYLLSFLFFLLNLPSFVFSLLNLPSLVF